MGGMTPEQLLDLASAALKVDGAEDVEAFVAGGTSGLTRFAGSRIHQSTWRQSATLRVRVALADGRVGVATSDEATVDGARDTGRRARAVAEAMPPDAGYPGMTGPGVYPDVDGYDPATAAARPADRAALVAATLAALPTGVTASGALETNERAVAIANSNGMRAAHRRTQASGSVLADAGSGTGWAQATTSALADLDGPGLGRRAGAKSVAARDPEDLPPGTYPVVLEPVATATLVDFLAYLGFGGRAYHEGRSFLAGRMGSSICDERVTIVDDALEAAAPGTPFDYEGIPKRRTVLVDGGRAAGLVYDRRTAREYGTEPTGHSLPAPSSEGAFPLNLALGAGGSTQDELIARMEHGLLVTRFHYTNVVNPMETTITGMTRDGTFLIEDGRVTRPVRNLRFTQSILGALSGVRGIGRERVLVGEDGAGAALVPALALDAFTFSSATTF